jgi:hypothetical protein
MELSEGWHEQEVTRIRLEEGGEEEKKRKGESRQFKRT